nr:MAG TPA: hypothetical protein [Caudoviricetes sp.]
MWPAVTVSLYTAALLWPGINARTGRHSRSGSLKRFSGCFLNPNQEI